MSATPAHTSLSSWQAGCILLLLVQGFNDYLKLGDLLIDDKPILGTGRHRPVDNTYAY